jgi:pilus assembly protein CpaF
MNNTLRERLKQSAPTAVGAVPSSNSAGTLSPIDLTPERATPRVEPPLDDATSGMFSPRHIDHGTISPVDALKADLHRKLIERLDLEALETMKDEAQITGQIR